MELSVDEIECVEHLLSMGFEIVCPDGRRISKGFVQYPDGGTYEIANLAEELKA